MKNLLKLTWSLRKKRLSEGVALLSLDSINSEEWIESFQESEKFNPPTILFLYLVGHKTPLLILKTCLISNSRGNKDFSNFCKTNCASKSSDPMVGSACAEMRFSSKLTKPPLFLKSNKLNLPLNTFEEKYELMGVSLNKASPDRYVWTQDSPFFLSVKYVFSYGDRYFSWNFKCEWHNSKLFELTLLMKIRKPIKSFSKINVDVTIESKDIVSDFNVKLRNLGITISQE
jgi:hypothetical protein